MDQEIYDHIKEEYGKCASWAIWNPKKHTDLSVIDANVKALNPNIIIVGLNVSKDISQKAPWTNFHTGTRDYNNFALAEGGGDKTARFNEPPYRGAYMTDVLKYWTESNSKKIVEAIKKDPARLTTAMTAFLEELEFIGAIDPDVVVVLGDVARDIFAPKNRYHFDQPPKLRTLRLQYLPHPSPRNPK